MKLNEEDFDELQLLAIAAAERAAEHIRSWAGENRSELNVLQKEGGSSHASQVVTEVDLECEHLILKVLGESVSTCDLGLLTEERQDNASRLQRDYFWCIDPLDGTLPFIENVAGYSVSIALVNREGVPVIGVIVDPVEDVVYSARRGGGAFRNQESLRLRPNDRRILTLVMDRSFRQQSNYQHLLERVEEIAISQKLTGVEIIQQGGAAMNACWVIENAPAVYFKFPKSEAGGGSLWDYAASSCIFAEVGAVATDIAGNSLKLNRSDGTFMNKDGVVYASELPLAEMIYRTYQEIS